MIKQLFFIIFSFALLGVYAQSTDIIIRENYTGLEFYDFATKVSNKYNLKFYYPAHVLDSVTVVQEENDSSLVTVIKKSLATTNLDYYIDKSGTVFITENYDIVVSLPLYFYELKDEEKRVLSESSFLYERQKTVTKQLSSTVVIGDVTQKNVGSKALLRGRLLDENTGEPIIGAVVWSLTAKKGTATDFNGNFLLELPKGRHKLELRSVGKETIVQDIVLYDDGDIDFSMIDAVMQLADVRVVAEKFKNVEGLQMGLEKVNVQTIKQLPTSMGEVDVLKVALMLPGVQTVGEGASGFNVRGGSTDQNLILIDQSPIFNTSHLFGFFSVFNSDIINDFALYKSAIPSQYGGRISSVFDVSTKSGNKKKWEANLGVSPVTGKLMVEGPIIKNKTSILLAGRTTYSDWILSRIDNPSFNNSEAYFNDFNVKLKHELNEKNFFNFSFYRSYDYFKLNTDTTYNYSNINSTFQWKNIASNKLFVNTYFVYSNYSNTIGSQQDPLNSFSSSYNINYKELKTDFNFTPTTRHKINAGGGAILYGLEPGTFTPIGESSLLKEDVIQNEKAIETYLFLEDEINVTERLAIKAGLRYAMFFVLGDTDVPIYQEGVTKSEGSIRDTLSFGNNKLVKTYHGPEWRFSTRYKVGENTSLKFSYNRLFQYIHMMTNTTSVSPTDIWKLSDYYIEPQKADLFTVGIYKDFLNHLLETSAEVYYKSLDNQLEFKGGTQINMNHTLEADLLTGQGKAYGVELLIKKKHGYLNGWLAYTYSRSFLKVNGEYSEEKINDGDYFPTNFDKPHDLTLVLNNKFSRRFSVSSTLTYSTGRPTTYPVAKYEINGVEVLHYSDRNEYRIPDYFRWDLSVNIEGNLKKKKLAHTYWTFSVYNVTGRSNVYSEYFKVNDNNEITAYRMSIFARPIFTITFNVKI